MPKKDSHHQSPASSKLFIINSAFKHYERDKIDSTAVTNFNHLIHSISLRLLKNSTEPDIIELFRITNELIIGFIANLAEQTYRHTCTHEDIIYFFMVVASYFEKSITAFGISDTIIQSNLLNIFWPLFGKASEGAKSIDHNKIELINNLLMNIEELKIQKVSYQPFVKEAFIAFGQSGKKQLGIEQLLKAFLRNSSVVANFKPDLLKYMTIAMAQNLQQHFRKILLIYQHIGSTFEERRIGLENVLLKTLEYNNCIAFLCQFDGCMSLSKLISPTCLPLVVLRTTERLFAKNNLSSGCLKIIEQLSQIDMSQIKDINADKLFGKSEHLVVKFLQWALNRYLKKNENDDFQRKANELREKMLENQPDLKEERILEFVKKLSNRNVQGDEDKSAQLKKLCLFFGRFVRNLCKNPVFKEKLMIKDLDSLSLLKNKENLSNQTIQAFILEIIPPLIDDVTFNLKDKYPLKHAIMLRAAQLLSQRRCQAGKTTKPLFKQIFFQLLQGQSLNYHYALCYAFVKYEKEKEGIRQLIVDAVVRELQKEGENKNCRNLILSLSLFLKSLDNLLISQPIKYKIKHLTKNIDLLTNKLDINQLFCSQPKEYINTRHNSMDFTEKICNMKKLLNQMLSNYSTKQNLNLFYSLVLAVNDIIDVSDQKYNSHSLLAQITSLRKKSRLGQLSTNIHVLNETLSSILSNYDFTHPKIVEAFMMLIRLHQLMKANNVLKESEDTNILYERLSEYILMMNKMLDNELLDNLVQFKTRPDDFSYQNFVGYIEDKQVIKFYSQSSKDVFHMHIIMSRLALAILKKVMEVKKVQFNNLNDELKNIFLLYSNTETLISFGYSAQHETALKNYLSVLLLSERLLKKMKIDQLVKKMMTNAADIRDIVLPSHANDMLSSFKAHYPVDFFKICLLSVKQLLENDSKDNHPLFELINRVIQEDNKKCGCLSKQLIKVLQNEDSPAVCQHILSRTKRGLEEQLVGSYFEHSTGLYRLISKAIEKDKSALLSLLEDLVQLDCYSSSQKSAFILKEISYIFTYVEERNSQICETIFNYILTLTEVFVGDEKLEISNFICNFFGLEVNPTQEVNLDSLERCNILSCTNNPNYKCLKCDEKKVVCLSCALTCHQNHPVCFLNIPGQLKFAKCLCSEIGNCKLNNKDKSILFGKPKDHQIMKPPHLSGPPQIFERMKIMTGSFGGRPPREQLDYPYPERIQMQLLREEQILEQQMRSNQWYDNIRPRDRQRQRQRERERQRQLQRQSRQPNSIRDRQRDREYFFSRIGGRMGSMFDRDEFPPGPPGPPAYRAYIESNERRGPPPRFKALIQPDREQERQVEKERLNEMSPQEVEEPEFSGQSYEDDLQLSPQEMQVEGDDTSTILKKYVLLPKFIELMVNFCNKKADKSKAMASIETWKLSFSSPPIFKVQPANTFKLHGNGTFNFEIRKENAVQNMSCTLIKKTVAQNDKFILLASSTEIFVFSKEKLLNCVGEMKPCPGYNSISRHSIAFEVHSLDFSPNDKSLFCAAGLHNITLLNINSEGHISRSSYRYNVSNFYINKIKLTKMGIFVGVDKQIRILNYTCRQILSIRAQQVNTLIRQWTIFEKAAGCQILFADPNGNIFTSDILPSDQDKKQFICKVNDHRTNKTGVGASISGKDLPQLGKYLFASFKDGSNILGHLETDQLENMINMQLKGMKYEGKNIFDSNFIIGHAELVKYPRTDELFLICTVKKYFPPEMSFHQGYLVAFRFKKGEKKQITSEITVINQDMQCEYFTIIRTGKKNFFIYSVHADGSVQITTLNKLSKQTIDEEIAFIKESEDMEDQADNGDKKAGENVESVRKTIAKVINLDKLIGQKNISSANNFREGTQILRVGADFSLIKHNQTDYEVRYNNFNRIVTGFSLPFYGEVELPTRTTKLTFEVGFTQAQALYFFAEGGLKFKYIKNEDHQFTRQSFFNPNTHPRMLEKLERIQRLNEYPDGMNSHLMNSILGFKEDSAQIQFIGKSFEIFKAKIPKFQQTFKVNYDDESSSIEKTALIIKMFLTKSLKDGIPCGQEDLLSLIDSLKMIVSSSSKRLFTLLKEIIVLATKVYQKQTGKESGVADQGHALRAATEGRLVYYYNTLKIDISDNELNDFLDFLLDILYEDEELMAMYVAKYSGIFMQFHRRLKKADTEERAKALIELYTFAYPILKYCTIPCSWILSSICTITFAFNNNKTIRYRLYHGIKRTKRISFQQWLRNICNSQGMVQEVQANNNSVQKEAQDQPKDQMMEIYNMFNRGQIDEETLFKMISQASKLEYERQQQNQIVNDDKEQIQPERQQEMEIEQNTTNHNITLVVDLMDECTDAFADQLQAAYARIMTLYVASKAADNYFQETTVHLLKRIKKMVSELDLKVDGDRLTSIIIYSSLFNRVLNHSNYLKKNDGKQNPLYKQIEEEVNTKLAGVTLETVPKIKKEPNLLGRVFRDDRSPVNIHIAYALTSLLLFPCEATHVLLSLQCYWLLPESKEFYSKKKDFSNITDGIQSGNIQKVYDIANENPHIWQEYNSIYNNLEFVEAWIDEKKNNWELALQLLVIYYQD